MNIRLVITVLKDGSVKVFIKKSIRSFFSGNILTLSCPEAVLQASLKDEFIGTGFLTNTFTPPLGLSAKFDKDIGQDYAI